MTQTPLPTAEIELFKQLPAPTILFDVGARIDVDYLQIWPKCKFHLFEPNLLFHEELSKKAKGRGRTINTFGLGDKKGTFGYCVAAQGIVGGESTAASSEMEVNVDTLDNYVKKKRIKHIDILKIDTEGYDYKVLLGGKSIIPNIKFIQYEHWINKEQFHKLLEPIFTLYEVGYRNVLCINNKLVDKKTHQRIAQYIKDNELHKLG